MLSGHCRAVARSSPRGVRCPAIQGAAQSDRHEGSQRGVWQVKLAKKPAAPGDTPGAARIVKFGSVFGQRLLLAASSAEIQAVAGADLVFDLGGGVGILT